MLVCYGLNVDVQCVLIFVAAGSREDVNFHDQKREVLEAKSLGRSPLVSGSFIYEGFHSHGGTPKIDGL